MEIKELIKKAVDGVDLAREQAREAMSSIMKGEATPSQIACLITALRMKGESIAEITGFAEAMRQNAIRLAPNAKNLVDTCGTGGDVSHTFNISTAAAIAASAAGVPVAKHGNRSVSSKCGSADVLEALGIRIHLEPQRVQASIDELGFGFIFAQKFHPAMKFAMPSRREIGIRTVFNILGPLTNPASAPNQLLGVYSETLTAIMAAVLKELGSRHVMVIHGLDGLDEITISDRTRIAELKDGEIKEYFIAPEDFGIKRSGRDELVCQDLESSKNALLKVISGEDKGARRDVVLLNAGAAIYVGSGAADMKEGVIKAAAAIDSGRALQKLDAIRNMM